MIEKLRNFTPHPLHIVSEGCPDVIEADERDGYLVVTIPSEVASPKEAPRVEVVEETTSHVNCDWGSVRLIGTSNGEVVRLPDPIEGTLFIVSKITLDGSDRKDLICVYDTVRNAKGWVMGCRKFSRPKR